MATALRRARDFDATWAYLRPLSITFWAISIEELYHFRKSAHVDDATSRQAPLDDSSGPEEPQVVDFGPKRKNHKTIEKPIEFYVFWVHTNDGAMQENRRHRNKIVKNKLFLYCFLKSRL